MLQQERGHVKPLRHFIVMAFRDRTVIVVLFSGDDATVAQVEGADGPASVGQREEFNALTAAFISACVSPVVMILRLAGL